MERFSIKAVEAFDMLRTALCCGAATLTKY
jgi:hypothetical protein